MRTTVIDIEFGLLSLLVSGLVFQIAPKAFLFAAMLWELAIMTNIAKPVMPASASWRNVGKKVNDTLNSDDTLSLFISGSGLTYMGGQARKFVHVRDWEGLKFYQHCKTKTDMLAFRPIAKKVCNVSFAGHGKAGNVKIAVCNALSGDSYGIYDIPGTTTVKMLLPEIVKKLIGMGFAGVSRNAILTLVQDTTIMKSNAQVQSLAPAHLRLNPGQPTKDGKIQTKLVVKTISKK